MVDSIQTRCIITVVTILALSSTAFTQDNYSIGVRGGLNYATIGGDAKNLEPRVGFHVGLFCEGGINDVFKFGTELQYSSQGTQTKDTPSIIYKYNYLTLPFLLKVVPPNQSWFYIQIGPQFGYLLNAKKDEKPIKDEMNMIDLSLLGGVGFSVTSRLSIFARYSYGLTSTADKDNDKMLPNRTGQFGIAFALINSEAKASKE